MELTPRLSPLTPENHSKGFLIDEELMGGVSRSETGFLAYILSHQTGQYLGAKEYPTLEEALHAVNNVKREWQYESASECGGGACQEGNCGTGSCKKVLAGTDCIAVT